MTTTPIRVLTLFGAVEVQAYVFGEWAAHPALEPYEEYWTVSHVPNGRTIIKAIGPLNEASAVELAKSLGERVPRGRIPIVNREAVVHVLPVDIGKIIRSIVYDVRGKVLT